MTIAINLKQLKTAQAVNAATVADVSSVGNNNNKLDAQEMELFIKNAMRDRQKIEDLTQFTQKFGTVEGEDKSSQIINKMNTYDNKRKQLIQHEKRYHDIYPADSELTQSLDLFLSSITIGLGIGLIAASVTFTGGLGLAVIGAIAHGTEAFCKLGRCFDDDETKQLRANANQYAKENIDPLRGEVAELKDELEDMLD